MTHEDDDSRARRTAERIAGPVDIVAFRREMTARGYSETMASKRISWDANFWKTIRLSSEEGHDPPIILIYWYTRIPWGKETPEPKLEIQIRGEDDEDSFILQMFSYDPEVMLLRLEEIEERLIRAWKAVTKTRS